MINTTHKNYNKDALITKDIGAYLNAHQNKSLLRFVTCGSVDDGKSTLIGRLLYDCKAIFEDQLIELKNDSKKTGTQGENIDFALLVDGLVAEREQGITIDVAYRFFSTEKSKFIITDSPGHEQYTRNMVTAASTADLAIILVDATKGIVKQTRRHSYICHLLGIKKILLAINKMDLVNFEEEKFQGIVDDYQKLTDEIGINSFVSIPISAINGDNIVSRSENTPWYKRSTILSYLENCNLNDYLDKQEFCMPVQWVNRPNSDFRGFSGKVASGIIQAGDKVLLIPSYKKTLIKEIVSYDGNLNVVLKDQSITLTFVDEVDCSRGDLICSVKTKVEIADQFETMIIWTGEDSLIPGRSYFIKIGTKTVTAKIAKPKYQININTLEKVATNTLELNSIGLAIVTTDQPIYYMPFKKNKVLGGFIIIDKISNSTVGLGLINFALYRSQNIYPYSLAVGRKERSNQKNQEPKILWFTGLSGSGKSTIANALEKMLMKLNYHTFLLDGDNIRSGLNKDLGFKDIDRIENIRRVGEVAKLMMDSGLIVITAFISPFREEREMVRKLVNKDEFIEVFINTPLSIAEKRDPKGLYAKARLGEIKNFTGIDSPYEIPHNPEIIIDTSTSNVDESVQDIINFLLINKYL